MNSLSLVSGHEFQWPESTLGQEPGCICTLHPRMLGVKEIFPWEMEVLRASSSEHLQSEVQSSE